MNKPFTDLDHFNQLVGCGGMVELLDMPLSGRVVAPPGIDNMYVEFDKSPDLVNGDDGYTWLRNPISFLIEKFTIHADDDNHPGRHAMLYLEIMHRPYGRWALHAFRKIVEGSQWSDAWYVYALDHPIFMMTAAAFRVQLVSLETISDYRSMSVVLRGKVARPV